MKKTNTTKKSNSLAENKIKKDKKQIEESKENVKESKLVEKPVYDLRPQYDSRQSFYGKARVNTGNEDNQNQLYSYGTLVAEIVDGVPRVYGTYSNTTLRHIKEWLKQLGFRAETSKQIIQDYGYNKYRGGRMRSESCNEAKNKVEIEDYRDEVEQEIEERKNENEWYVLKYDVETTGYNNDIVFKTYDEALKEFDATNPSYENERIELIFSPDEEYGDNMIVMSKTLPEMKESCEGKDCKESKKSNKSNKKSIKESLPSNKKKTLKEGYSTGIDVLQDLIERAQSYVDEGADVDEAVWNAIDEGLIYTEDIVSLALYYGTIDSSLIETYFEQLADDIFESLEPADKDVDEDDDYVESLMRKYGVESQKKESKSQPQRKSLKEAKKPIRRPSKRTPVKENKKVTKK